ncbi:MAG: hypothetical protein ACK42K_12295 [Leptonema sp. (in: bacteria)]
MISKLTILSSFFLLYSFIRKTIFLGYVSKYSPSIKDQNYAKDQLNQLKKLNTATNISYLYPNYCIEVLNNPLRALRIAKSVQNPTVEVEAFIKKVTKTIIIRINDNNLVGR